MKKILSILLSLSVIVCNFNINVFAYELNPRASICVPIEGYTVLSRSTYNDVDNTIIVENESYTTNLTRSISTTRTKKLTFTGGISLELIEDLLKVNAELAYATETTTSYTDTITVEPRTIVTYEVGAKYITATIQWERINEDCTKTRSGPVYSTTYTYAEYVNLTDRRM